MGALHALLQFVARASGVISGRLADILSPARMVILGTLLTALCKPMFAVVGWVEALLGTAACVSWITFAKVVGDCGAEESVFPLWWAGAKVCWALLPASPGLPLQRCVCVFGVVGWGGGGKGPPWRAEDSFFLC